MSENEDAIGRYDPGSFNAVSAPSGAAEKPKTTHDLDCDINRLRYAMKSLEFS